MFELFTAFLEFIRYYVLFMLFNSNKEMDNSKLYSYIYGVLFLLARLSIRYINGSKTIIEYIFGFAGLSYLTSDSLIGILVGTLIAFFAIKGLLTWKHEIDKNKGGLTVYFYYSVLAIAILLQVI